MSPYESSPGDIPPHDLRGRISKLQPEHSEFEQLFREHYEVVFRFVARRLPPGAEEPADLVQDAFLRLWREWEDLDQRRSTRAYLITIANRLVIDRHRRRGVREHHRAVERAALVRSVEPLEEVDLEPAIRAAIHELPDHLESTFVLSRIDGLTYREIAEVQGVSAKAVEARMTKALRLLRDALAPFLAAIIAIVSGLR